MKLSFRWFGPEDPVPLAYIAQIPAMRSVVTAVYDVPPGQLWPMARLEQLRTQCQAHGLVFDVVESLPVHEHIKLGSPDAGALLETYCENIRRCAAVGVRCITYNFMPVFDWLRTDLAKPQPDGATALALDWQRLAAMDPTRTDLHLPGWDESYAPAELRELLGELDIDKAVVGEISGDTVVRAPGMKYRHYAPKAPVTVFTGDPAKSAQYIKDHLPETAGVICFSEFTGLFPGHIIHDLGPVGDKAEQARRVFDALREFDHESVAEIYAQCPDAAGLGLAIGNRLKKAAGFHVVEV